MSDRPSLDIIIPHYGGTDLTWRCLVHLWAFGVPGQRIVVIDDASPDNGPELGKWLVATGRALYHRHETNRGCTNAWNTGLDLTRKDAAPWTCFLNNDVAVMPGVMEALLGACYGGERCVGANAAEVPGNRFDPIPCLQESIPRPFRAESGIGAICFIVDRGLVESLGGFDGRLTQAFGDADFELRARNEHDVVPKVLCDAKVYHGLSVAAKRDGLEKSCARFISDQAAFRAKWGDNPSPRWRPMWNTEDMLRPLIRKSWEDGEQ